MRLIAALAFLLLPPALASAQGAPSAQELRARGNALRAAGDYDEALAAYQAERAAGGETADVWKHIGWTEKARRHFAAAEAALVRATELDPADREAQDDLANLRRSRGLALRGWLGGTEPGTSKNAFEAQASYGGLDRLEGTAGGSWTDNIFYTAYKAFAEASWFYRPDSYVRGAFTYRSYDYTGASRPTPDSNAYQNVPRPEVEISHWLSQRVRVGANYQLFLPNFQYDRTTRFVNHKVSGDLEVRLGGGLSASLMGAWLRDPSPGRTLIQGRPLPGLFGITCPDAANPANCATATRIVYRSELLLGGGLAYDAGRWSAGVRYIPNRDLDSGFAWSLVSAVDFRPADRWSVNVSWILDKYATVAGPDFAGRTGNIYWATARHQLTPALALAGGLKWVNNPSPKSTTNPGWRDDPTLLLQAEYLTGAF